MADAPARDAQAQLSTLEEEERLIMRELRDMDRKAHAESEAKRRKREIARDDPEGTLSSLLLECEKEVREAKAYIADDGPPLKIVRVPRGETAPKGATYLSKPKGTGVDFTVPVTLKAYTDLIKRPIFLNQVRDKIRNQVYSSSEDYLDDMRLLARNTATFNKGPELSWVVQHARYLLEAAEDAVQTRRRQFFDTEDAMRQQSASKQRSANSAALSAVGKRKRTTGGVDGANGDSKVMPVKGNSIEVYWPTYRRWFVAGVTDRVESSVHVVYEEDGTDQWIDLHDGLKWRIRSQRAAATTGKGRKVLEVPVAKKRRGGAASSTADPSPPVVVSDGVSVEQLQAVKGEMLSKLDSVRDDVREQLNDHLERIDDELVRGDVLQRVLIAIQDSQASVATQLSTVMARIADIETKLILSKGEPEVLVDRATNGQDEQSGLGANRGQKSGSPQKHAEKTLSKPSTDGGVGDATAGVIEIDDAPAEKGPKEVRGEDSVVVVDNSAKVLNETDAASPKTSPSQPRLEKKIGVGIEEPVDVDMEDVGNDSLLRKPSGGGEETPDEKVQKDTDAASDREAELPSRAVNTPRGDELPVKDEVDASPKHMLEKAVLGSIPGSTKVFEEAEEPKKSISADNASNDEDGETASELKTVNKVEGGSVSNPAPADKGGDDEPLYTDLKQDGDEPSLTDTKKSEQDADDSNGSDSGDSDASDSDSSEDSKSDDETEQTEGAGKKPAEPVMSVEKVPSPRRPPEREDDSSVAEEVKTSESKTVGVNTNAVASSFPGPAKVIEVSSDGDISVGEKPPENDGEESKLEGPQLKTEKSVREENGQANTSEGAAE